MPFLDSEGLRQYTAKVMTLLQGFVPVTRKINGKPLTSDITTHTAGEGVVIDGDTISLDNPMRGIVTQDAYDALSKEEQDLGTYIIKDLDDVEALTPITDDEIEALFPVG